MNCRSISCRGSCTAEMREVRQAILSAVPGGDCVVGLPAAVALQIGRMAITLALPCMCDTKMRDTRNLTAHNILSIGVLLSYRLDSGTASPASNTFWRSACALAGAPTAQLEARTAAGHALGCFWCKTLGTTPAAL